MLGMHRLDLRNLLAGSFLIVLFAGLVAAALFVLPLSFTHSSLATDQVSAEALGWVGSSAEVMAGVLAVAVTVVAIVVELAANRYSHRISELFFSDLLNRAVLVLLVVTTLICLWVSAFESLDTNGRGLHKSTFIGVVALVSLSAALLIPFFIRVFAFLSPASIVQRIYKKGQPARVWRQHQTREAQQAEFIDVTADLYDVAGSAIEHHDRSVALAALNALFDLLEDYHQAREEQPDHWRTLSLAQDMDPDFVAFSADARAEINANGTWLETKVLRQALTMTQRTLPNLSELAHLYIIRCAKLFEFADSFPHLFEIIKRSFNSMLRAALNADDQRTAYYVLAHYRKLAESAHRIGREDWTLQVAEHISYYSRFAYSIEMTFLLEVGAFDLAELIRHTEGSLQADHLLALLLELDKPIGDRESNQSRSLQGVRRAQIRLATHYLESEQGGRYERLLADLAGERFELVAEILDAIQTETQGQYWEFTERGDNFNYLDPELRRHLPRIRADLVR